MACEPVRELFPAARRDAVRQPLVVLLAFLPGLLVFWNPSLDELTCEEGLRALDVGARSTAQDWIGAASGDPSQQLAPAKPLATLLTALGLKLDLFAPESRLLFASYVSSVFLLVSLGDMAKRVGGSRFALLVVLLACGHREYFALSGGLPSLALPLAFAVLSFHGLLAHQLKSDSWISWSLVGSGLALAACWLSGGELAMGTWSVLCVQSVFWCREAEFAGARTLWRRRIWWRLGRLAMNLSSLLVISGVGLVVVGGWQLAFSEELDFLTVVGRWSAIPGMWTTDSRGALAAQFLLRVSGAWLGFVMLGAMQLARGGQAGHEQAGGRRFLCVWLGVASLWCWLTWSQHGGEFLNTVSWPAFFLLSLLFLAAWGLEAVLLREFGLASVTTAVLVTIGVQTVPFWPSRIPSSVSGQKLALGVLLTSGIVLFGAWLIRRLVASEHRRSLTVVACVALMIALDVVVGMRSRPPLADDERELLAIRRQLAQGTPPRVCWLVTDGPSPARLRFFLRSLWPGVEVREARGEEMASANPWPDAEIPPGQREIPIESNRSFAIVVTWGSPRLPTETWRRRGQMLTPSAAPHFLQGRPLRAYRWALRSSPPSQTL